VGDASGAKRAHLGKFQRQKRDGVSVVVDELHFERLSLDVHQHGRTHVTPLWPVFWQVARQCDGVKFFKLFIALGAGVRF
jgi:hypothetical protein